MTKTLDERIVDLQAELTTQFAYDATKPKAQMLELANIVFCLVNDLRGNHKTQDDKAAPDVLDRVLALAKTRADELMKIAGEFTYSGLADYYRYGADCLYDFAATLRKEFNRD